jgi:hypothetical protein
MKTLILIEVEHKKPIPALANMIAGRAYTIDGVTSTEVVRSPTRSSDDEMQDAGFTLRELSLGAGV